MPAHDRRTERKSLGMSPNLEESFIERRSLPTIAVSTLVLTTMGYAARVTLRKTSFGDAGTKNYGDENPGCTIEGFDDVDTGLPCEGRRVQPVYDNADKGFFEDVAEMAAIALVSLIVSALIVRAFNQPRDLAAA